MTATCLRRSVAVLGLLALSGLSTFNVVAQTPAAGRLKVIFIATGSDGQPLAGLQPGQVELRIDGKPRQIQDLQFVKLGGAAPAAAAPGALSGVFDSPMPPPYGETAGASAPGRNIMIVVDEESMRAGADRPMKDAIEQFLGTLGASDRAGIVGVPRITTRLDPTTNRNAFREAVARISGRMSPNRDKNPSEKKDEDRTQDRCHSRDVLQDLTAVATTLGEGPTTVVVFSSGLAAPSTEKGECELTTTEFDRTRQAIASSRAIVYVAIPETAAKQDQLAGLQNLAGSVGSPLLNVAGADPVLTRVFRESGNYYVAEINVDAAERDGKGHRVDFKMATAGASVRGQSEIMFAKAAAAGAKASAKDLVKDGKSYSDLPIRVTGYVSRGTADKLRIVAVLAPVDPSVKFSSVSIGFLDPSNKGQNYNVPSDDVAKPFIMAAVEVAPGSWRLHAAAVDGTGRIGTADYQVDAQLVPAGPMKISALMLGSIGPNGLAPKMAFTDESEAVVNFDLYGTTQAGIIHSLELADKPDGAAIKTGELQLGRTSDADRFTGLGKIDIKDLKPGDYVVRLTFQVEGSEPGKVFRTLRKLK